MWDWLTFSVKYPELTHCEFKPTSFTTYQRNCADSMRKLSNHCSPNVQDRSMFDSPQPAPDRARYEFNPDREHTPPRGMDNTIRFKSSGENSRRYKFFAEDLNGMYYECKDRDRPRKEAGSEHLYPYTAPDDVFRLTATESSTDSKNISTGHRASRIRRNEERERVRREMKYSNSDDSMNSESKEDMQKPFLSKKTHKVVTLSDDEREASLKIDEFKHEDCTNKNSSSAPSSDSSSEDDAPPATEKEANEIT